MVVIELQLGPMNELALAPLMDLNIMVIQTGRERTRTEYGALFAAAGLCLANATPMRSGMTVTEAILEPSRATDSSAASVRRRAN